MKTSILCCRLMAIAFACVVRSALAAEVIYDFETDTERKAVSAVEGKAFLVCVTNAFATSGTHALGFTCQPWKSGMPQWPSFTLKTSVKDWSGYDRLVVDVVNVGEAGDSLGVFIAGPEGRVQNGLHSTMRLPGKGYVQWVIPLKKWPKAAAFRHALTSETRTITAGSANRILRKRLSFLMLVQLQKPLCIMRRE